METDKGESTVTQIIPIKDLRDTTAISERCHAKKEPVFVTKNGYGDLVIMSIETYESLMGERAVDSAIAAAEEELNAGGEPLDAKQALKDLRRKHFVGAK